MKLNVMEGKFSVHIFGKDSELENANAGLLQIKTKPLFFEQRNYSVSIELSKEKPEDKVEFWHESRLIREKITETGKLHRDKEAKLSGTINFGNEIGSSVFDIKVILIEHHRVEPKLQLNRLRSIYSWAKRNGYDEIWTPRQKASV